MDERNPWSYREGRYTMILFFLACAAQADEPAPIETPEEVIVETEPPPAPPEMPKSSDPITEKLMTDMVSLELYLMDKTQYKEFCVEIEWQQPAIEIYKESMISHLPEECKAKIPVPEPVEPPVEAE